MASANRAWQQARGVPNRGGAVLPIGQPQDLVVSPDEVRVLLAQTAERHRVSARESDRMKRDGVATAEAMAELCRATFREGGTIPWMLDFVAEPGPVADRCGMSLARVRESQDALVAAAVLERHEIEGTTTYRFVEHVWEASALSAAIDWDGVRALLRTSSGALPSCLGVLRELARATPAQGEAVSISLSELARRTWFSETVVDSALRALVSSGLIERESTPRRVSQFLLTDVAFGAMPSPLVAPPAPASVSPVGLPGPLSAPRPSETAVRESSTPRESVSVPNTGAGFVLSLGGGELVIPAGMRGEVTGVDSHGRPVITLRVL